jgi:hypothetical protein
MGTSDTDDRDDKGDVSDRAAYGAGVQAARIADVRTPEEAKEAASRALLMYLDGRGLTLVDANSAAMAVAARFADGFAAEYARRARLPSLQG